jgi:hypothetical protein
MLRKFKVTYIAPNGRQRELRLDAYSRYDAKKRVRFVHPEWEVIKVEEVQG